MSAVQLIALRKWKKHWLQVCFCTQWCRRKPWGSLSWALKALKVNGNLLVLCALESLGSEGGVANQCLKLDNGVRSCRLNLSTFSCIGSGCNSIAICCESDELLGKFTSGLQAWKSTHLHLEPRDEGMEVEYEFLVSSQQPVSRVYWLRGWESNRKYNHTIAICSSTRARTHSVQILLIVNGQLRDLGDSCPMQRSIMPIFCTSEGDDLLMSHWKGTIVKSPSDNYV